MKKETFVQITILIIILLTSFVVFRIYFFSNNDANQERVAYPKKTTKDNDSLSSSDSTQIQNMEYVSSDQDGNSYKIISETGSLGDGAKQAINMQKVTGKIVFNNSTTLIIISDNALYDVINYNTNFYDNVLVKYDDHLISSDNLDLIINENMLTIFGNIVYKENGTLMYADKIEMDIITKDIKIFMNEENRKIKILNNNTNGNN
tara:strand:+ start:1262 stop:1876 length:615 start_codon:yes stop_codon:yes gene_type:complete